MKAYWTSRWQPVVDAFTHSFEQSGEQGAGLSIYHQGELQLNIWAGYYDNREAGLVQQPWSGRQIVNIFSAGKGLVALCVLQLASKGKLNLDNPIANYWPEFATVKNEKITVREVLSHRSGLSAFHQPINESAIFDWDKITAIIADEPPWWPPGAQQGYSPFIFGWILGELVRRVSGLASFNEYFQKNIATPLDIDCYFGVPEDQLHLIADTRPLKRSLTSTQQGSEGANSADLGKLMKANPRGVTNRAFANPISLMTSTNSRAWRQAQIPAANAHSDAHSLACIYGTLAYNPSLLLDKNLLPLCWQEETFDHDHVLGLPLRFSHGFMLSQSHRADCRYGRGVRAFGHPGAGGSVGFADPDNQLGFGYVTAHMGQSLLIDQRAINLIDAAYSVINAT